MEGEDFIFGEKLKEKSVRHPDDDLSLCNADQGLRSIDSHQFVRKREVLVSITDIVIEWSC